MRRVAGREPIDQLDRLCDVVLGLLDELMVAGDRTADGPKVRPRDERVRVDHRMCAVCRHGDGAIGDDDRAAQSTFGACVAQLVQQQERSLVGAKLGLDRCEHVVPPLALVDQVHAVPVAGRSSEEATYQVEAAADVRPRQRSAQVGQARGDLGRIECEQRVPRLRLEASEHPIAMSVAQRLCLTCERQAIGRVGAHSLEQPVANRVAVNRRLDERLRHERAEQLGHVRAVQRRLRADGLDVVGAHL